MNLSKIIGIILIVLGGFGLAYGGFSYTKETSAVKLGRWNSRSRSASASTSR